MLLPTANWLEVLWVSTFVVSLVLGLWALWDAWEDDVRIRAEGAGIDAARLRAHRVISRGNVRRECLRVAKVSLLLGAGLVACAAEDGPLTSTASWYGYAITGALILVGLLFATVSLCDRGDRHQVYDILRPYLRGRLATVEAREDAAEVREGTVAKREDTATERERYLRRHGGNPGG